MIITRWAVCSERHNKPLTRVVCDSRAQAESELDKLRQREAEDPEEAYWIAEVGPESEAWRWLVPEVGPQVSG